MSNRPGPPNSPSTRDHTECADFYRKFVRRVTEEIPVTHPKYQAFCEGVGRLTGDPVLVGGVMTHIIDRHHRMSDETWAAIVAMATLLFSEDSG